MYTLTLTASERRAFDWVGHRYASGEVASILQRECTRPDAEWESEENIAFSVPESLAWQIRELADTENHCWPCFGEKLVAKMNRFLDAVV